jgi:cytochrome c-type protein NapC
MADAPKDAPSGSSHSPSGGGFIKRTWAVLRRPSASLSLLTLVGGGFVAGIIFWGGFNTAMEATNTLEFCTGCHEMRDTVYQEYRQTIHASNRTGVRAICSDCHVPRDWVHKVVRKVKASRELYGKITGIIDTPEKFEAHRPELAKRVWAAMEETNSRECRNCHSFDGMNPEKQSPIAAKIHASAKANGRTCIQCHKGIAHKLPAEG